jgi:hypothetical protein
VTEFVILLVILLLLVSGRVRLARTLDGIPPACRADSATPVSHPAGWRTAVSPDASAPRNLWKPNPDLDVLAYASDRAGYRDSRGKGHASLCTRLPGQHREGRRGTEGQLKFHKDTEARSNHIADRLHAMSTALFGLTIVGISIHPLLGLAESVLVLPGLHLHFSEPIREELDRWLVLVSAFLPALAAALAGISNQGEFARVAKRSAAMADSFKQFAAQITQLRSSCHQGQGAPKLSLVIPLAGRIAEVMVDEVPTARRFHRPTADGGLSIRFSSRIYRGFSCPLRGGVIVVPALEAPAVIADFDDVAVVAQTIEQRGAGPFEDDEVHAGRQPQALGH